MSRATSREYPLRAALELRERAVDDAIAGLAEAVERHMEAERALEAGRGAEAEHRRGTADAEADEHRRGLLGLRADELLLGQRYLSRRGDEARALAAETEGLRGALKLTDQAVDASRDALATARAEHRAVEKHEEAWRQERRKRGLAAADEEAEERAAHTRRD